MARPPASFLKDTHPDIAAQLVDQSVLDGLGTGSNKKLEWRCVDHPDHTWFAAVCNRTNPKAPTGCPICNGKIIKPGFNDVATTHPDIASMLVDQSMATQVAAFSSKKLDFRCSKGHVWTAPIRRLASQGSGCPYCSGRRSIKGATDLATTHPDIAAQLVDQSLATELKAGSMRKVQWRCTINPNHIWETTPYSLTTKGSGCPYCSGRHIVAGVNDLATTHPELVQELADPQLATTLSRGSVTNVEWVCTDHPEHTWLATPTNRVKGVGCPICVNKQVMVGFNDLATTHPHIVSQLYDPADATTVTAGTGKKLRWVCPVDPDHLWLAQPSYLLSPRPTGCPVCYSQNRSAPEFKLVSFLEKLLPEATILTSDKTILGGGRELDIVIPDKKIAIEFNGVWWHCEANVTDKHYHRKKTRDAATAGYQLIHVWEDDWFNKQEIVLRGIAHRLGATTNLHSVLPEIDPLKTERIFARQLTLTHVNGSTAREFWAENHLQGPVNSKFYFGLIDDDDHVRALLGVGQKNHGSRVKRGPGMWDIQRYATCGAITGGFTRLLAYAEKEIRAAGFPITAWTSYSDDDISGGSMYLAAGFTADHHQDPSYSYIGGITRWTRSHRANWMRHRFETDPDLVYEDGWTEHQAALANNLYRIYDAGKTRWIKPV